GGVRAGREAARGSRRIPLFGAAVVDPPPAVRRGRAQPQAVGAALRGRAPPRGRSAPLRAPDTRRDAPTARADRVATRSPGARRPRPGAGVAPRGGRAGRTRGGPCRRLRPPSTAPRLRAARDWVRR